MVCFKFAFVVAATGFRLLDGTSKVPGRSGWIGEIVWQQRHGSYHGVLDCLRPRTWDGFVWTLLDTILNNGLDGSCLTAHYVLSLCWPLCSLAIGTALTLI